MLVYVAVDAENSEVPTGASVVTDMSATICRAGDGGVTRTVVVGAVVVVWTVVVWTVVVVSTIVVFGGLLGGLTDGPATATTASSKPARPTSPNAPPTRRERAVPRRA
jgi:hypothetical protein